MLIGVQSDEYIKKNCWEKTAPVDFRKKIGKPIRIPASGNFRRGFTFYQAPPSSLMNLATNIVSITPKQNKPANGNLVEQVVEGLMKHEEQEPPPPPAPPPQPPNDGEPDLYGNAPAHPVEPPPIYPVNRGRPVNPNFAFPAGGYPAPPDTYREGALEAPASQQAQRLAEAVQRGRPGQLYLPSTISSIGVGTTDYYPPPTIAMTPGQIRQTAVARTVRGKLITQTSQTGYEGLPTTQAQRMAYPRGGYAGAGAMYKPPQFDEILAELRGEPVPVRPPMRPPRPPLVQAYFDRAMVKLEPGA
jgi:hypothetical protein